MVHLRFADHLLGSQCVCLRNDAVDDRGSWLDVVDETG